MDISHILDRVKNDSIVEHGIADGVIYVRRPTRREVIQLLDGVDPVRATVLDMFTAADRMAPLVVDWHGFTADGAPVAFSQEIFRAWQAECVDEASELVEKVVREFNECQAALAAEKKA